MIKEDSRQSFEVSAVNGDRDILLFDLKQVRSSCKDHLAHGCLATIVCTKAPEWQISAARQWREDHLPVECRREHHHADM